jgi:hypothetical protein
VGGPGSFASGTSDSGLIAGESETATDGTRAVLWTR